MPSTLEVLFTPAEFAALKARDLADTVCVVFDVLRATTSMLTALENGATRVFPVADISDALALRRQMPDALLAGEREGLRIRAAQTGGTDFDLGNSPREFTHAAVSGNAIIMTTTNGTRALQSCAGAARVLAGAFLNLSAIAHQVQSQPPANLLVVCAGTFEQAAYEDTVAAGALCDLLWASFQQPADSAQIARELYLGVHGDMAGAVRHHARNARRLLTLPDLCDDVAFCLRRDTMALNAELCRGANLPLHLAPV